MIHDLFSYPNRAGYKEHTTSKAAAASMDGKLSNLQQSVLLAIRNAPDGLTADEAALHIGETVLTVRPRCAELRELNKIVDSGALRKNTSGRNAIVWTAVQSA